MTEITRTRCVHFEAAASAALNESPRYLCRLMQAGRTGHGSILPVNVLQSAVGMFEGAPCLIDHTGIFTSPSLKDLAGTWEHVFFDGLALHGELRLNDTPAGELLSRLFGAYLEDSREGRSLADIGLSADVNIRWQKGEPKTAEAITKVWSVDAVLNPAAGGRVERILHSLRPLPGGAAGNIEALETLKIITQGGHAMSHEATTMIDATSPEDSTSPQNREAAAAGRPPQSPSLSPAQCRAALDARLAAAELPPAFAAHIRDIFQDRIFEPAELEQAVSRERQRYASLLESETVRGMGRPAPGLRLNGMWTGLDRLQFAVDELFGIEDPQRPAVEKLRGIQELYLLVTGDRRFQGVFNPERTAFANANSGTMAGLVANVMNKVVAQQWDVLGREGYLWWQRIVHHEDFSNLQQIQWTTVGGFGDLPTIDEGAAYNELTWDDAKETADWSKKGGYLGLTLEMIDRDQTARVKSIPYRLATSALRTVSGMVSNIFTASGGVGPTLSDGNALFHAVSHKNLLTTALDGSAWTAVVQAMYKQTELNSGKRLGIRPRYLLVPIELEKTAVELAVSRGVPGSAADYDTNIYGRDGYAPLQLPPGNVITVPEWTDAADWAAVADPAIAPGIGVGYRYGRQPEIFVASDELTGSMFTNDELRIKVRWLVAVGVINFRALHKCNVA